MVYVGGCDVPSSVVCIGGWASDIKYKLFGVNYRLVTELEKWVTNFLGSCYEYEYYGSHLILLKTLKTLFYSDPINNARNTHCNPNQTTHHLHFPLKHNDVLDS